MSSGIEITGEDWEQGLAYCIKLVREYLEIGECAHILKASDAIGVGFVQGIVG